MSALPRPTILIVDDRPANLKALRALLRPLNVDVLDADGGNAALGLMLEHPLALILLDVDMPGMDGYEVARMAKGVDSTKRVPIIFMTAAYHDDLHRATGYRVGAADYLEKPINGEILLSKARVFLELYNAQQEASRAYEQLQREVEQRRETEERLRLSEEHLQNTQRIAGLCSWERDPESGVFVWSDGVYRLLGIPRGHPVDMGRLLAQTHPEDRDRVRQGLEDTWTRGRLLDLEFRLYTPGGALRHLHAQGQSWHDDQGLLVRTAGTLLDISSRREVERRLGWSEQRLHIILDTTDEGYWQIDPGSARILDVNPALCRMLGYPRERLLGATPQEFAEGENREIFTRQIARIWSSRQRRYEITLTTSSGRPLHAMFNASSLFDAAGSCLGAFAFITDITSRRQAEDALRVERQRLENIIEATGVGTWEWDMCSGRVLVNERWAEMIGWKREELEPLDIQTWRQLVHPEDQVQADERMSRHFSGELSCFAQETRLRHRNGTWVWVLERGRVISRDGQGRPQWMAGTHTDISGLKNNEARLQEARVQAEAANRAKSAFLANMSHEIRTPLNAILGMAELLSEDNPGEETRRFLEVARSAGDTLMAIINDVLDLARLEADQLHLEEEGFDLRHLVNTTLAMVEMKARDKGLEVSCVLDDQVPRRVWGDAARLQQILLNLLGNAVKFTDSGTVTLEVTPGEESKVMFRVKDTGIGIPADRHERIFDRFAPLDDMATRRFGGTGVGLAMARRLAEMMGGTLTVSSREGMGSVFQLSARLPPPPDSAPSAEADAPVGRSRSSRLVDAQDPELRLLLAGSALRQSSR
ncbi:MAG: PAS domain S-box protein [Magnetococcus sp. WYHC-3]